MKITIHYKHANVDVPLERELTPDEYFLAEPGLEMNWDQGVPIHDHAIDYLPEPAESIEWTRLVVDDQARNRHLEITETFWNGGLNRVIERLDSGSDSYNEIILDMRAPGTSGTSQEIVRLVRRDGRLEPCYHGFLTLNEDGAETERVVGM